MPTKFKPTQTTVARGTKTVITQHFYIKNTPKEELIEYAAYAESYSNHPIAVSILKAYEKEVDKAILYAIWL